MAVDNEDTVFEDETATGDDPVESPSANKKEKKKSKKDKKTAPVANEDGGGKKTKSKTDKKKDKKKESGNSSKTELLDLNEDEEGNNRDDDQGIEDKKIAASESTPPVNRKKKKKSKKKDVSEEDGEDGDEATAEGTVDREPGEGDAGLDKKKKKKKSGLVGLKDGQEIPSTSVTEKGKSKKSSKKKSGQNDDGDDEEEEDENAHMMSSARLDSSSSDLRKSSSVQLSDLAKYSVEYFEFLLQEVKEKCQRKLKLKSKDRDAFADACNTYYETWYYKVENEQWLNDMLESKNGGGTPEEIAEAQQYIDDANANLPKCKRQCIRSALKIFESSLDEERMNVLEERLVKGAIIAQATPQKLADFAAQSKDNEKLLKRFLADSVLMKEMLRHGGAAKYEYGNAMKIYFECVGDDVKDDEEGNPDDDDYDEVKEMEKAWARVNKRIALACALELASPVYEFDSTTPIDAVARYKHFEKAHRKGELDPAFPFFSVWEMRQIINCDAPNEQMEWCREMVMNYSPHLTCLTDQKLRYVYMLQSDVRIRKPEWTASPRTYPMVLSGGGNESINSWFGRFLLKSFGLPAWGTKHRRKEGYTRWTPNGWEAMNGADWEDCSWQGKTGKDFKTEIEARNKAPPEEYFKKLVTLQCLADVVDEGDPGDIPEEEKDVLHGDRLWRSMSLVSMALLFETEPEVPRTFERKGCGLVVTKCEKYLSKFENDAPDTEISYDAELDVLTVPSSRHGFGAGNIVDIESYEGGKQVNFVADGVVEYDIPDAVPDGKKYMLTCEVCTVSSKQTALTVEIVQGGEETSSKARIKVPYTIGKWDMTAGVEIELKGGATMKVSRPKGSLGVAIKKFVFTSIGS